MCRYNNCGHSFLWRRLAVKPPSHTLTLSPYFMCLGVLGQNSEPPDWRWSRQCLLSFSSWIQHGGKESLKSWAFHYLAQSSVLWKQFLQNCLELPVNQFLFQKEKIYKICWAEQKPSKNRTLSSASLYFYSTKCNTKCFIQTPIFPQPPTHSQSKGSAGLK